MNAKPHTHAATLKRGYNEYSRPFGERWRVNYGDQTQELDLPGDPYKWDPQMRECVVGQAVREVVARHDEATAVSQQLESLLNPAKRPWWKRLFQPVEPASFWSGGDD